jgi:hypothetical protein
MATRANLAIGIIGSTAKAVVWVALVTLALGAVGGYAFAQAPAAATPAADDKVLSKDELNALVGKIALYPDDLVAIVLPAATYPLQVVEAERFLQERQKDPSLKPSDKWDDSIVALLNYPEVVRLMNDDLDWTWKLGDAVINQRGAVLDAIQGFRGQAQAAGNLHTDEHQVVQNDDQGDIDVKPADPQVVYVPYYDPQQVVVQQPAPVYYYYPYGYPLYYYPYPYGYSFAAGYFWGVTTAFVIGWHSHYVHVVHCGYPGHPYYGHTYYGGTYAHGGYYVRNDVSAATSHGNYVWEPHYRAGGQPFTRSDGRQLAIAHHDPNAGGAPSGYHNFDRSTPPSTTYRAAGTSNINSWHGNDAHANNGYADAHGNDGHSNNGYGDGHGNGGHANNGYDNGHGNDGHSNNGYGDGHGNDGHANNGYGNGHGNDGHSNNGYGDGHGNDGHANNGYGNGHGNDGHSNNGYGDGHGNDGHANNGYGNGHGSDGHSNNGYGDGHGNDGHANNGYGNGHGSDGHSNNGYGDGHGNDGHSNNGYGNDGHANNGYGNGHGTDGHGNSGYGDSHGGNAHGSSPNAPTSPGFRDASQSVPSGAHGGMKQIQPIRNDPPTQAAIRNELRDRSPDHTAFTSQSPGMSGHNASPPHYAYQSPNQSMSFRDPAAHSAPQIHGGMPQYTAPQSRGSMPQFSAPQARNVPQATAPQMHTMPMPSAPTMAPHQGGASYVYRSPSMPQASSGHAPAAHQGGSSHGGQSHGGGGHSR